jgi:two-component system sensor histidine kinase ArlS
MEHPATRFKTRGVREAGDERFARLVLRSHIIMSTPAAAPSAVDEYTKLISLAVHEMRTPASVISGYLRLLQKDPNAELGERQRHMIDEAERSCVRLVGMLNELSELGKMDTGTAVFRSDAFDLFELLVDVAANVQEGRDRDMALETHGLSTHAPFSGDRARIRAALEVVVRGVMREQPASTTVVVDARRVAHNGSAAARIVVAPSVEVDRAAGTSPSSFDDYRGGLGLGLPIARRVIGRYGGQIWSAVPDDRSQLPMGSRGAVVILLPLVE